jgi:hypothetical protein
LASFPFCLLVAAACHKELEKPPHEGDRNSGPSGGAAGTEPPTTAGGDAATPLADGGCTDLEITGTVVDEQAVNGDFIATGGDLLDGTYDLVQAQLYLGPSGLGGTTSTTYQGSVRINGTSYESAIITTAPGAPTTADRELGVIAPDGSDAGVGLVISCPSTVSESLSYSSNSGNLTLYFPTTKLALVLRQRP